MSFFIPDIPEIEIPGNLRITNFNHAVWQLILLLRQITELICASKVSLFQVLFLQHLINEYLEQRKKLFPDIPLRPKHHYMYHYPFLIMKCGPQIRQIIWILRMESKHMFFKRSARSAQNFINITKHLAGAHQLLQSYVCTESSFSNNDDGDSDGVCFDG